ncbi:MAG TPA: hypothetical protein VGD56_05135 [Gemmatirosa sp.]
MLRDREPALTRFAFACLALGGVAAVAAVSDPRLFDGVRVWIKPAKFFASIGVFAMSWAAIAGLVRADRRDARVMRRSRWTLIGSARFELAYITLQAARGQASHFNTATPTYGALYAAMGLAAVALIGTTVPLAWEVARRPAPGTDPDLRDAVVLGLGLTFVLGGVLGGYISAHGAHAVGPETGHLAVLGWNRGGGDLRVAHFLGLHAEQGLPLVIAAARALGLPHGRRVVWGAAALWAALTLATFAQAVTGHPFPFG